MIRNSMEPGAVISKVIEIIKSSKAVGTSTKM